jgi:hypothetical protein
MVLLDRSEVQSISGADLLFQKCSITSKIKRNLKIVYMERLAHV